MTRIRILLTILLLVGAVALGLELGTNTANKTLLREVSQNRTKLNEQAQTFDAGPAGC